MKIKNLLLVTSIITFGMVSYAAPASATITGWQLLGDTQGNTVFQITTDSKANLYVAYGNEFLTQPGWVAQLPNYETLWHGVANSKLFVPIYVPHTITIDKNNNIYIGNYNAVLKLVSGQWKQLGQTLRSPAAAVAVDSNGLLYVAGSIYGISNKESGYIYKMVPEKDVSWQPIVGNGISPDNSQVGAMYIDKKNNLYIGTQKGNVYQLPYGGMQWLWMAGKSISSGFAPITSLVVNDNSDVFAGSTSSPYLYKLLKDETQWQLITLPFGSNEIGALALDKYNNIYCGSNFRDNESASSSNGKVYKMPAGTDSWVPITSQPSPDAEAITSLAIDPSNTVYASTIDHIYSVSYNPTYSTNPGGRLFGYDFYFYYGEGVNSVELISVGYKEDSTGGPNIASVYRTKATKKHYSVTIKAGAPGSSGTASDFNFRFGSLTEQESHMLQIMPYGLGYKPVTTPVARLFNFFVQGGLRINGINVADDFAFGHNSTNDQNWWIGTRSGTSNINSYDNLELSGIDSNGKKQYFCLFLNGNNYSVLAKAGNCH